MAKVCPACYCDFAGKGRVEFALGIATDSDVGVRLPEVHGPFVVECIRHRRGRMVLATPHRQERRQRHRR
jgi:hypothetical protein